MKVETEHQFLRRVRRLQPEQAAEAIEQRWHQLYGNDTIYDDDQDVNDAIHRMIAHRKKHRYKTHNEWIHGTLNKIQHLSNEHKIEAILHHVSSGHQGFFLPFNLKPENYGTTKAKQRTASEVIEQRSRRFDYS